MLEDKPEDLTNKLSKYIALQSHIRIVCQFRNPNLSEPYYEQLKGVGVILPLSLDRKEATDDHSDAARLEKYELNNDQNFLMELLGPYYKANKAIGTLIYHILKRVEEIQTGSGDVELYIHDTHTKFHNLLLFLLQHFKQSLQTLVHKNSSGSDHKPAVFKESVEKLAYNTKDF